MDVEHVACFSKYGSTNSDAVYVGQKPLNHAAKEFNLFGAQWNFANTIWFESCILQVVQILQIVNEARQTFQGQSERTLVIFSRGSSEKTLVPMFLETQNQNVVPLDRELRFLKKVGH